MTGTRTTEHHERIVVGVDGSPASQGALEWAVGQGALTGAVVEAVTAWHFPATYGGYPIVAQTDWQSNGFTGTPSFLVGPTGGTLRPLEIQAIGLDEFTSKIDQLLQKAS